MNDPHTNAIISKCPYCGGESGYYDKNVVSYEQHYTWKGYPDNATGMNHVRGGTQKFCQDCNKRLRFLDQGEGSKG